MWDYGEIEMKTVGETLGELFIGCVEGLTPEEREDLYVKNKIQGKTVEFILPDEHEAVVIDFGVGEGNWVTYKSYSTPEIKCKKCGWQGIWSDLNIEEKQMDLTGRIYEGDLFDTVKKIPIEKCIKCGSPKLKYKDWIHKDSTLVLKGNFGDIGSVAGVLAGSIWTKLKNLMGVMILMIKGRVSIKPILKLGTGLKVSRLITGDVSESYKED